MHIHQRLQDMREDADLTQADVARVLNTSQQQYSRWESGAYPMPIDKYKVLARFYNISLDYLTGLINTPKTLDGRPYSSTGKRGSGLEGNGLSKE